MAFDPLIISASAFCGSQNGTLLESKRCASDKKVVGRMGRHPAPRAFHVCGQVLLHAPLLFFLYLFVNPVCSFRKQWC